MCLCISVRGMPEKNKCKNYFYEKIFFIVWAWFEYHWMAKKKIWIYALLIYAMELSFSEAILTGDTD